MNLRPYQQSILDAVARGWQEFRRQLVVAPTGSGKTIMFANIAAANPGRTLILAHREELIEQAIAKLQAATGIVADKEKADSFASHQARVVVGSIQTMCGERLLRWPSDHFDMVIVDEAHHTLAESYLETIGRFHGSARVLGVTATPDRGDKKNLGEYFENIAYEIGLFDLINTIDPETGRPYLSPITLKAIPLRIDISSVGQSKGDFDKNELGNAIEPYLGQIAQTIREQAGFRRVLAFLPLIATSQKFVEACRGAGLRAEHVDGNSDNRAEILARFSRYEFDVLSNAMLLTEGYDDPGIDCVVVLRPTRSRPLYCQMVGRGTRTAEAKENLLLLDFLWHHSRHNLCRPAHLIAKTEEEAEAITQLAQDRKGLPAEVAEQCEFDLQGLAGVATHQREETLRKKLEEHRNKKAKTVSAEEFALSHNSLDAAEYEPVMQWESNDITDKQARVLKRAKIDLETVRGRGHASKLIDLIFKDARLQLATPGQQKIMRRMGHPNADVATADEARKFFAGLRNKKAASL